MTEATVKPRSYLPPEYEVMDGPTERTRGFDPAYTADITYRMSVPHRIAVDGRTDDTGGLMGDRFDSRSVSEMKVPAKLIVVGHDESIGVKEDLNLRLEFPLPFATEVSSYVNVSTPPRVLTLDELPFPTLDDGLTKKEIEEQERKASDELANEYKALRDGLRPSLGTVTPMDGSLIYVPDREETIVIQRHLARLSRHISRLEAANVSRGRRELVLYPVVIGYVTWCFVKWFINQRT